MSTLASHNSVAYTGRQAERTNTSAVGQSAIVYANKATTLNVARTRRARKHTCVYTGASVPIQLSTLLIAAYGLLTI